MFNLEQAISEWRRQMLAAGIKSPVPLEELESHLREEVERLIKSGINEQQAFEMTIQQMGQAKELKGEFAKDKRLMGFLETELVKKEWELKWMPVLYLFIFAGLLAFFGGMMLFKKEGFSQMAPAQEMSALAALIVSDLLFASGFLGHRFFPVIPKKRIRVTLAIFATVLVSFWIMIFLAHANYGIAEFVVAFCWAFFPPMAGVGGLIFGLEQAAQKRGAMVDS